MKNNISEFQPRDISGYDHPEEIFFPEISYPPAAKEEDLVFPSITEDEARRIQLDRSLNVEVDDVHH